MAANIGLNNFRFSVYIDADGTVTFTDLPPELREIADTLDPSGQWGTACPIAPATSAEAPRNDEQPPGR